MLKKLFSILLSGFIFFLIQDATFAASGGSTKSYTDLYSEAKRYVVRAKKLEKKDKMDRAITVSYTHLTLPTNREV